MESFEEKLKRVLAERVSLAPYSGQWPELFRSEAKHLSACLPSDLVGRIEHFGSTAVPGLIAKPIVDLLVEVTSLAETKIQIAPVLESQGYDYFWRPTFGDDGEPFYAWFIKRDKLSGVRTHHIHMVEHGFYGHWERLLFRDFLIEHPRVADDYGRLKELLITSLSGDRVEYTKGKTDFIVAVTRQAKELYGAG